MLHEIVAYARAKGLDTEPGFAPKTVKWSIQLSPEGQFLGLTSLAADKKSKGRDFTKCPNLSHPELTGGTATKCHFLVESLRVVAHLLPSDNGDLSPEDKKARETVSRKHTYFREMCTVAAAAVPTLEAVALMLSNESELAKLRTRIENENAKDIDSVTFYVEGLGYLVDRQDWHDWWRTFRRQLRSNSEADDNAAATGTVRCFLSGELVTPAATHEKIKWLTDVGANAAGSTLISFKPPAFCSYGFDQSANAAMSVDSAKAYVSGLNDLLQKQSRRFTATKIAFWYRQPLSPAEDALSFLESGNNSAEAAALSRFRELLGAVRTGLRPDLAENQYLGLEISGNAGRVVVRGWWEGSYQGLLQNTISWFDDLSIVGANGHSSPPPRFGEVLRAALLRESKKKADQDTKEETIPASLETALWRAALEGLPIPDAFHTKVLIRVRTLATTGEPISNIQAGLLKAFHRRRGNYMPDVQVDLDGPVPYQCGRLLAMLANLQQEALGDVGAGVVERYYPAASSAPALVLGRLILNAQNHLQKLRSDDRKGLGVWFDRQLADILSRIPIEVLPKTLNLEDQSLFALGYYQQKARPSKETSGEEKEG